MQMRKTGMFRLAVRRLTGATLAASVLVAVPQKTYAQSTTGGSSATPGQPASVLDRIRKRIREANAPGDKVQKWFDALDLDKNEEITKQELFRILRRRFENMDRSGDGFVSKAEYMARRKDKRNGERRFGELDSNADGRLSMSEFASPADWRFDRIDRNLDGKVSRPEAARLFDRPVGTAGNEEASECFYVERQVVRVKEEVAETFRKRGYPKADCSWTPDVSDAARSKKFTQ